MLDHLPCTKSGLSSYTKHICTHCFTTVPTETTSPNHSSEFSPPLYQLGIFCLHSTPPLTRLSPELKIPLIAICKLSVKGTHSSPDSSFLCCPLLSNQWLSNSGYQPRCPEVRAVVCFFFLLEK